MQVPTVCGRKGGEVKNIVLVTKLIPELDINCTDWCGYIAIIGCFFKFYLLWCESKTARMLSHDKNFSERVIHKNCH
jgi:hypothetical protein